MGTRHKKIPLDIKQHVLHESGFFCANPSCRQILTLDIHHLQSVAEDGSNDPQNLIALCPNCHAAHHKSIIPLKSIRAWKMLAISLNEGLGRRAIDILLALNKAGPLMIDGEGALHAASLIASDLVRFSVNTDRGGPWASQAGLPAYKLELTEKGRIVVEAWKEGDQERVINAGVTF